MFKKNRSITLDNFIEYCLYDKKNGYYMTKNPFGITGDFITAPNISRLFSEMIAIWTIDFWENLGCPKKFNLIELGAGNGEMMKIMIESFKRFPTFLNCCKIIIHEKSPKLIKNQKDKIKYKNDKWIKNIKSINKIINFLMQYKLKNSKKKKKYGTKDWLKIQKIDLFLIKKK